MPFLKTTKMVFENNYFSGNYYYYFLLQVKTIKGKSSSVAQSLLVSFLLAGNL